MADETPSGDAELRAKAVDEFFTLMAQWRPAEPDRDRENAWHGSKLPPDLDKQRRDLAGTIADQAQAIADGTVVGPERGAVSRLVHNVNLLDAWTPDDRSGMGETK